MHDTTNHLPKNNDDENNDQGYLSPCVALRRKEGEGEKKKKKRQKRNAPSQVRTGDLQMSEQFELLLILSNMRLT